MTPLHDAVLDVKNEVSVAQSYRDIVDRHINPGEPETTGLQPGDLVTYKSNLALHYHLWRVALNRPHVQYRAPFDFRNLTVCPESYSVDHDNDNWPFGAPWGAYRVIEVRPNWVEPRALF